MKMTKQEFLAKYGHIKVRFLHYYKNTFTYAGHLEENVQITCCYDLTAGDIYRHEVIVDTLYTISELTPHSGRVSRGFDVICAFNEET